MDKDIKVTLKVWRQKGPKAKGQFETYPMEIHQSVSFLEMLDILNECYCDRHLIEITCKAGNHQVRKQKYP